MIRDCQTKFNPSAYFKPLIETEVAKRLRESDGQFRRRKHQKRAMQVKIGHGGTLDPLATGVLILGVGSATKALSQFLDCTKTYETIVLFGVSTDTYDRVGRVLTHRPYDHITRELVEKELENFRGKRTQMPPLYSALKMNGKPLYEYAREGKPIPREIEGREVEALEIELVEWYEPGKHGHRWPAEQAEAAERNLAEQVWRLKKLQETSKKLTAEEKELDDMAIAAHETFKRKFEERQDELIRDSPSKRQRHHKKPPMMSGALGQLPQHSYSNKGANLVPESPAENTPPPWNDEGPPAAKIRLTVTSGYYVRSFCHDLGARVGSAAIMSELCRTRQSDFTVGGTNCLEFDELEQGEEVWGPRIADMLARWNAEPEGQWSGTTPSHPGEPVGKEAKDGVADTSADANHLAPPGSRGEKRARSPSSSGVLSPPHKTRNRGSGRGAEATGSSMNGGGRRGGSDDEKSWNGIEG